MVFDTNKEGSKKRERKKVTGILVSISSNSNKCKLFDKEKGLFSWVQLSILKEAKLGKVQDNFFYVTAYNVDYSKMPELKHADELLIAKKKPLIELDYFDSNPIQAVDENGLPKMVESVEIKNGAKVITKSPLQYINHHMSQDDVINSFRILEEDITSSNTTQEDVVEEEDV